MHVDEVAQRESEITDYGAYYDRLRDLRSLPTTSQPSIGDFLAVYEPLLDAGTRSSRSTSRAACPARSAPRSRRARRSARSELGSVFVVDSRTACGGEGLIVLAGCAGARAGWDGAAVAAHAEQAADELQMWFAIDTLEYLRRGGRIAGAQAWMGSALRIKPILTVKSEITPVERVRTSKRAFEKMVDLLRSRHEDGADAYMVQHIQAPEQAAELAARGREIFGVDPLVISEIGPVIGTHVGPGLLGAGGIPRSLIEL